MWRWNASSAVPDDFGGGTVAGGSSGGAILAAAPENEQASVQVARFDTAPRVAGDAPVMAALALLDPPLVTDIVTKTYYYAGSSLIAMRVLTGTTGNTLYYLHTDHLGSTSLTTNITGTVVARQYYYPYGGIRSGGGLPTDIGFTGQRAESSGLGSLMFFRARYYSPLVGRFLSADTLVPEAGNPQSLNRYSYTNGNPLKYIDPTGHWDCPPLLQSVCNWAQKAYGAVQAWWFEHDPCSMSVDASCGRHDYLPPTLSETGKQIQRGLVANSWGGIDPETIRRVSQITDAAERLTALSNLFGSRPADPVENTIDFATSSRQEQLDQLVAQYFGDIGFDVAYGGDLGEASWGYFAEGGRTSSRGVYYERDTVVISEKAFKEGWDTVGTTIFHEWLHGIDSDLTEAEVRDLEKLWREWFNQNK